MKRFLQIFIASLLSTLGATTAQDVPNMTRRRLVSIISDLSSLNRQAREGASESLRQWTYMQPEIAWRAILSHAERASEPEARARCWQLLKEMAIRDYEQWGEGYIGISMGQQWSGQVTNDSAPRFGMIVTAIVAGSPAAEAKLAVGDIIVGLNELTWRKPDIILDEKTGLSAKIRAVGAGQKVVCIVWRKGQLLSFEIRLSRRPKQIDQWRIQAQQNGQWRLDASEWQKLADEEKGSKEYFDEWLRVKKASIAH